VTGESDLPVFSSIKKVQEKLQQIFTIDENRQLMTDFLDYVKGNVSALLEPDGEYPNRRVLAKNRELWEAFKQDKHAFKGFDKDNKKLYLAMYVGKIVIIGSSDQNFYSNDISLDGSDSYILYSSGKKVPDHNGYLLDSASVADPATPPSQMKELAAKLGWAHLFQHRCIHYNCLLDTVSFTKKNKRNENKETKLPVICWRNNSTTPNENEELTINYSDNYVKPLEEWLKAGHKREELKKCECQDCKDGTCTNYMPREDYQPS